MAEVDRCPDCRHAPHDGIGFCPNMASDNDCSCTHGATPTEQTSPCPWNGIRLRTMDDCTCRGEHTMTAGQTSSEGGEGLSEAEHRCVFGDCDGSGPSHIAAARHFFWPAREAAMDAAVHEVTRDFIVEALSWAETVEDGRLGNERADALLSAHEGRILADRLAAVTAERDKAHAFNQRTEADKGRIWQALRDCCAAEASRAESAEAALATARREVEAIVTHRDGLLALLAAAEARLGAVEAREFAETFLREWARPYFGPDPQDAVGAVQRAMSAALANPSADMSHNDDDETGKS